VGPDPLSVKLKSHTRTKLLQASWQASVESERALAALILAMSFENNSCSCKMKEMVEKELWYKRKLSNLYNRFLIAG
jgi:hypothetical protein